MDAPGCESCARECLNYPDDVTWPRERPCQTTAYRSQVCKGIASPVPRCAPARLASHLTQTVATAPMPRTAWSTRSVWLRESLSSDRQPCLSPELVPRLVRRLGTPYSHEITRAFTRKPASVTTTASPTTVTTTKARAASVSVNQIWLRTFRPGTSSWLSAAAQSGTRSAHKETLRSETPHRLQVAFYSVGSGTCQDHDTRRALHCAA